MYELNFNNVVIIDKLVTKALDANKIKLQEIHKRLKDPASIFRKVIFKNIPFDEVNDIIGYRLIVQDKDDCYAARKAIDKLYFGEDNYKDYISTPKDNGYQSLHLVKNCSFNSRVEIQIRTQKMHDQATKGHASHFQYKNNYNDYCNTAKTILDKLPIAELIKMHQEFNWSKEQLQDYLEEIKNVYDKFKNLYLITLG